MQFLIQVEKKELMSHHDLWREKEEEEGGGRPGHNSRIYKKYT